MLSCTKLWLVLLQETGGVCVQQCQSIMPFSVPIRCLSHGVHWPHFDPALDGCRVILRTTVATSCECKPQCDTHAEQTQRMGHMIAGKHCTSPSLQLYRFSWYGLRMLPAHAPSRSVPAARISYMCGTSALASIVQLVCRCMNKGIWIGEYTDLYPRTGAQISVLMQDR